MSWVPLVGSGFGSILGGMLSDYCVRNINLVSSSVASSNSSLGRGGGSIENRAFLAAVSCLLSGPLIMLAIRADFPDCFIYMIFSGLLGEMYIGKIEHCTILIHRA